MFLKKIIMLIFIVICSISMDLNAILYRLIKPRYLFTGFSLVCAGNFLHKNIQRDQWLTDPSIKKTIIKFITPFRFRVQTFDNFLTTNQLKTIKVQEESSLDDNTSIIEKPKILTQEHIFSEQDQQSAQLFRKLMDASDTTPFKTLSCEFLKHEELNQKHPELKDLIQENLKSPDAQNLVQGFKDLSKQGKLPKEVDKVFQENEKEVSTMSWISWPGYLYRMNKKLSS